MPLGRVRLEAAQRMLAAVESTGVEAAAVEAAAAETAAVEAAAAEGTAAVPAAGDTGAVTLALRRLTTQKQQTEVCDS